MSVADYFDRNDEIGFSAAGAGQFARRQFKVTAGLAAVLFVATAILLALSSHPLQSAASTAPKAVKAQVAQAQVVRQAAANTQADAKNGLSLN